MKTISVDFGCITGKIKPVHGFNNCARNTGYGKLLPEFVSLNAPIVRLHDTEGMYGGAHYVDVPNIFPDFDADEEDENSYDFTLTDCYLRELYEAGIQIFYRLGVTIEHAPKKYNIYPPYNTEKWARVCEHIVRHYNDGWAQGYHWGIVYWEMWNEPDGVGEGIEPYGPPNWLGSAQDYYRLYSITANHLKKLHPEIKVGGYASCYILGSFTNGHWERGDTSFFTGFLDYITSPDTKAPLDFFSYHGYLGVRSLTKIDDESTFVRNTLDAYGFVSAQIIDDEWGTLICDKQTDDARKQYYINMRNSKGASHSAGAMFRMQKYPIDMAMFYDTQLWCEYGSLFNVPELTPTKTYYAFKQFSELYALGNECRCECSEEIPVCAATGEYDLLAVANLNTTAMNIAIAFTNVHGENATVYLLDNNHDYEEISSFKVGGDIELTLPAYSVVGIKFSK